MLLILRFSGLGSSLVKLDLISDDHSIENATIFRRECMKYHNLLIANWKNLITFRGRESISDANIEI